jgi:hypothetical protein
MSNLFISPAIFRQLIVLIGSLNKDLAYLDPGSGSFILQILLATLLASLLFMKGFWRKIVGIFKKPAPEEDEVEDQTIEKEDEEGK